jgi:hypothetical protein
VPGKIFDAPQITISSADSVSIGPPQAVSKNQNPDDLWVPAPESGTETVQISARVSMEALGLIRDVIDSGRFRWKRPAHVIQAALYWFLREFLQDYDERYSTFLKQWGLLRSRMILESQLSDSTALIRQLSMTVRKMCDNGRQSAAYGLVRDMLDLVYEVAQMDSQWAEQLHDEIQKDDLVRGFVESITGVASTQTDEIKE